MKLSTTGSFIKAGSLEDCFYACEAATVIDKWEIVTNYDDIIKSSSIQINQRKAL